MDGCCLGSSDDTDMGSVSGISIWDLYRAVMYTEGGDGAHRQVRYAVSRAPCGQQVMLGRGPLERVKEEGGGEYMRHRKGLAG